MYRIFISHASIELREAKALKDWLVQQDPPLANEIFLDAEKLRPGLTWRSQLGQAMKNCEAVVCMTSKAWAERPECIAEFSTAEYLNKRIFCVRLEPSVADEKTRAWQRVDLFGKGEQTKVPLDDGGPPIAFPTEGLQRLKEEIIKKGIGADSFVWPPPDEPDRAPYRGWEPLEEVDAAVYFGRDAELLRAMDKLRGMRKSPEDSLFVILGPSGAGKSSFLRAGLLPRLRRTDRDFVVLDGVVRPETHVLTGKNGLAEAIHATRKRFGLREPLLADINDACLNDADRVCDLLREIQVAAARPGPKDDPDEPELPTLVIPVDQAEELFSDDAVQEAPRFLDMIDQHSRAGFAQKLSLIFAITIRTDRHQALQTAKQLAEAKSVVFDDLKPMPQGQFREVIVGPARRGTEGGNKLEIDPALVNQLLEDCTEGADTLPLLALTLARLHKEYGSDGDLLLEEYERMGGMLNVVQTEVDTILSHDPKKREDRLARLRPAFVPWLATFNRDSDVPVRRVAKVADLPEDASDLLQEFVDRRLLMRDSREGGDVVEIALESLVRQWKELGDWLEEERADLKMADSLRQNAAEWQEKNKDKEYLLRRQRLAVAERLLNRPDFREHLAPIRPFVKASKAMARRRKAAFWGLVAAALVVALVLGIQTINVFSSKRETRLREQQNTAWQLVSDAEQILKGSRAGGDVKALQELIAADAMGPTTAEAVANTRRDELKIMENPLAADGRVMPVRSLAASPDGSRVVSGSDDNAVRVWDTKSGSTVAQLNVGSTAGPVSTAFSRDGRWIATSNGDKVVQVWDATSFDRAGDPLQHQTSVSSVAFNGSGRLVGTGGADGVVHVWDRETGLEVTNRPSANQGRDAVMALAFNPSADLLASGRNDGTVHLWDIPNGKEIIWPVPNLWPVTSVAYDPLGDRLQIGLGDGHIQTLDGRTLQPTAPPIPAHVNAVQTVAFSPDGSRFITGGWDNTVRVWDANGNAAIGDPLIGHHGRVSAVAVLDGTRIVSGGWDGSIRVWDVVTGLPTPTNQSAIKAVAFSPDGRMMASGGADGTVKLWDSDTAAYRGQLGPVPGAPRQVGINALAFSGDDRIVTGAMDGSVLLWDVGNPQRQPQKLRRDAPAGLDALPTPRILSVAFSPRASLIAAGGMDGVVRLWDAKTLEPVGARVAHKTGTDGELPYQVWSVAFSDDGSQLVTGSGDDSKGTKTSLVQLWNVRPLSENGRAMDAHAESIYSVAFSPDGHQVASGGRDGTLSLWDINSRQQQSAPMSIAQNPLLSVAFAHHQPWIATGGDDGKVRLWDISTGTPQPIGTPLEGHKNWVFSVAFSPNDGRILSGSGDGNLHLWLTPAKLADVICSKIISDLCKNPRPVADA
ncbi:TIR domain-containing protein [Mycobacterium sp.]|uniref:nSTAND1 domain-containing NTPase n=1 Tax=Mycobacterium sp. TaxID=1785 RepID=UPI002CDB105C|nr:TIR domain-containing protein [Mycobacterium sp.]HKP40677.1 TIR domain-containing protein [Mycobacterium sp.]